MRRLKGISFCMYKYQVGGTEEDGARLFSVVPSEKKRGNGHKLKYRKFHLDDVVGLHGEVLVAGVLQAWLL